MYTKPSSVPVSLVFRNVFVLSVGLVLLASPCQAGPFLYSTSDASRWQVATNVGGVDGAFSSFPTTGFVTATSVSGRTTEGIGWIANNSTGSNGTWTFFVFRQSFDLTGYDPSSVSLSFQWAADDSGRGILSQGSWIPKYRLNGGALINGAWPPSGDSYSFGPVVEITSGFQPGLNTIEFFVQGNGGTDGMTLRPAFVVPEPSTLAGVGLGLGLVLTTKGRRSRDHAVMR